MGAGPGGDRGFGQEPARPLPSKQAIPTAATHAHHLTNLTARWAARKGYHATERACAACTGGARSHQGREAERAQALFFLVHMR